MTIRDVNYINDVCRVVLSKPQDGGTIRISGTPTSLTESCYPSPTLDLDFAKTRSIDPRIVFSRSTTASYYDSSGFVRFAAVNEPRIQFDPDTKECLGLLMENVSTNIFTNSEWQLNANGFTNLDPDNTFDPVSTTVPTNETGTVRALIASNTTSSIRYALAAKTHIGTEICGFSAFFKLASNNNVFPCLVIDNTIGSGCFARFDLVNATVAQSQPTGSGVHIDSGIEKLPNGWCRCWTIGRAPATASGRLAITIVGGTSSNGYDPAWTPTATGDGVYVWGIQYEQGIPANRRRASSYIRTTNGSITRFADSASITGRNFSSWYNQSQGTILVDFYKRQTGSYAESSFMYRISDGTLNNAISLETVSGNNNIRFQGTTSSSILTQQTGSTQFNFNRAVGTYLLNRADLVSNATRPTAVDTLYTPPTALTGLDIGHFGGSFQLNDCIARLVYYPVSIDPNVTLGMSVPRDF